MKLIALTTIVLLAACASTPQNPFVGSWDVSLSTPIGDLPGVFMFNEDGTGTMSIEAQGQSSSNGFEGAVFEGNTVKFSSNVDAQGAQMTLSFTGTVEADTITGEFDSDFGAFAVTGTRKQ